MKLHIKTPADLKREAEIADRDRAIAVARAHLADTDWLVIRAAETGRQIPAAVAETRARARQVLSAG